MTNAPSPFHPDFPKLQTAWDSTSLGALMFCPRYYQMTILEGWREPSTDLDFGIFFATGTEIFHKARLCGATRDEAQYEAVSWALDHSGHYDDDGKWVHWGGKYMDVWHCLGTEPYKNAKGNRAKCPYSHKGKLFPEPGPTTCGECGSETEHLSVWVPEDANKNRHTLIRTLVWYCEEQPEDDVSGLQTINLPDGRPAVELPFRIPSGITTTDGHPHILCGYLDRLARHGRINLIVDAKTTYKKLSRGYFSGFAPNIQFDIYDLVGSILWPELELHGVAVDGTQTMQSGSRFAFRIFHYTEERREELMRDLDYWLRQAEAHAANNHWPMNRRNCRFCRFNDVCARAPGQREQILRAEFGRRDRPWNPLEER